MMFEGLFEAGQFTGDRVSSPMRNTRITAKVQPLALEVEAATSHGRKPVAR